MSTAVSCELYVDGRRFADGTPGENPLDPAALTGLAITWGRSTTVDQPETSTCEFDVYAPPGGDSFLTVLRTGLAIDVTATGTLYPAPDVPTITDPGFEGGVVGQTPPSVTMNASTIITGHTAATGRFSALLTPTDPTLPATVAYAPARFSDLPNAWENIPATAPGQDWIIGANVKAPAGATITLTPAYFTSPSGACTLDQGAGLEYSATGLWQTLTLTATPQVYGSWVAVAVTISGLARWVDVTDTWAATPGSWLDHQLSFIDDLVVLAPAGGIPRAVAVFSGRITDLQASYDENLAAPLIHVTAVDFTADLDNIGIGDEPWAVEPMGDRFHRILDLSGYDVDAQIDDTITSTLISYQDVDNRAVTGLLKDLAQSVDAIMWAAVHQTSGPYLRVEDPSNRKALFTLREVDGTVQIVPVASAGFAQDISACDVLRAPITWGQTVSDVSTRVAVTWLEQGVNEDGRPETTERTTTIIDPALEQTYGVRRISFSTMLQSAADADEVAARILGRTSITGWHASGFTIEDPASLDHIDDATIQMMLRLLDGTTRIGLPIRLTDLPDWSPSGALLPVYLEGGQYAYQNGGWILDLTVSQATAQGQSVSWGSLEPGWAWTDFDPGISWLALAGVDYPSTTTEMEAVA